MVVDHHSASHSSNSTRPSAGSVQVPRSLLFSTSVRKRWASTLRLMTRAFSRPAAIVPPLSEKEAPRWAQNVWEAAGHRLAEASLWIVVGYSLPAYDIAVRQLFSLAAATGCLREIRLHDPYSAAISSEWANVTKVDSIVELPGLERCV